MILRGRSILTFSLVALAVTSIAFGPSPAAAAAEFTARADRERAQRTAPQSGDATDTRVPAHSDAASESQDGLSAFVPPASAKPADVNAKSSAVGVLGPTADAPLQVPCIQAAADELRGGLHPLHRRPHFPNAPPQR